MKNRTIFILFACVLAVSFLLGATGTVTFAHEPSAQSAESAEGAADRLIGVFVTKEHLDLTDGENYILENTDKILSGEGIDPLVSKPGRERLYAVLQDDPHTNPETGQTVTTKDCFFPDVEGIRLFTAKCTDEDGDYWVAYGDEGVSDGKYALSSADREEAIDMEGTIYLSTAGGLKGFYFNPVYQASTGEVYTVAGQGTFFDGALSGLTGSHALNDEVEITMDGKTETLRSNIEVKICYIDTPVGVSILQYDGRGNIVSTAEYPSGDLPDEITAEPETEYIIVETRMRTTDGTQTSTRELFQPGDEALTAFFCREDGICVKQYCNIVWGTADTQ